MKGNKIRKMHRYSAGYWVNMALLILMALACLLPLLNMLATSLSDKASVNAGEVLLIPHGLTFDAYKYVLEKQEMWRAMLVTVERVLLGVTLNVALCVLCAYPLSKTTRDFRSRTAYAWFFFFTILFSGGTVPWFFLISSFGMLDTIWALVIPGAVPVFSVVLLLNFFRQLPKELCEAAEIDGANEWIIMLRIYVPTSLPSIATITLFAFVYHWNSWFDGMLLMNQPENMPLQTYIQAILLQSNSDFYKYQGMAGYGAMNEKTFKAAQVIVSIIPVLIVYPFVQKFFTQGIVMGSVKE